MYKAMCTLKQIILLNKTKHSNKNPHTHTSSPIHTPNPHIHIPTHPLSPPKTENNKSNGQLLQNYVALCSGTRIKPTIQIPCAVRHLAMIETFQMCAEPDKCIDAVSATWWRTPILGARHLIPQPLACWRVVRQPTPPLPVLKKTTPNLVRVFSFKDLPVNQLCMCVCVFGVCSGSSSSARGDRFLVVQGKARHNFVDICLGLI